MRIQFSSLDERKRFERENVILARTLVILARFDSIIITKNHVDFDHTDGIVDIRPIDGWE